MNSDESRYRAERGRVARCVTKGIFLGLVLVQSQTEGAAVDWKQKMEQALYN